MRILTGSACFTTECACVAWLRGLAQLKTACCKESGTADLAGSAAHRQHRVQHRWGEVLAVQECAGLAHGSSMSAVLLSVAWHRRQRQTLCCPIGADWQLTGPSHSQTHLGCQERCTSTIVSPLFQSLPAGCAHAAQAAHPAAQPEMPLPPNWRHPSCLQVSSMLRLNCMRVLNWVPASSHSLTYCLLGHDHATQALHQV